MKHLSGLTEWQDLDLTGTQVTDVGLEHLKGVPWLRTIKLNCTRITDAGLEHLEGLTQLRWLDLSRTRATDVGLEHLKDLSQLQSWHVGDTRVADLGLVHLKRLTQLEQLRLDGPVRSTRKPARRQRRPDFAAAGTYNAVQLLVSAIRKAGLNRARIGDALRQLAPWNGAAGLVPWDTPGGNTRPAHLATVTGDRLVRLDTPHARAHRRPRQPTHA
jgi:hypothetical protein